MDGMFSFRLPHPHPVFGELVTVAPSLICSAVSRLLACGLLHNVATMYRDRVITS